MSHSGVSAVADCLIIQLLTSFHSLYSKRVMTDLRNVLAAELTKVQNRQVNFFLFVYFLVVAILATICMKGAT